MANELKIEYLPIDSLTPYERNAKGHPQEQIEQIKRSIKDNGMNDPIGIWGKNNTIVEGHGRLIACKELGIDTVPCIRLDHMTDEQRRQYTLIHNQTTMNSGWDVDVVELELADMPDFDAEFYGFELQDEENEYESTAAEATERRGNLKERYLVPPFSVIYGNKPDWLARKREWVNAGLRSEIGRGGNLVGFANAAEWHEKHDMRRA